ncbi:MAG TPA: winged helix-turn-helix transcriptional regulator [Croceibacterium sp.]|nr:winged helix-turn-helix transcriptional regulator [Croceibacterium sp.]
MPTTEDLIRLSSGRWLVPLLALASGQDGLRFAEVLHRLGLARGVARASLDALVAGGWLARNSGHGHPLRPEYVLTQRGVAAGVWAEQVMAAREALGLAPDALTRWTLPLAGRLATGEARFGEISTALSPVSPRALSLTLKGALAHRLIGRRLEDRFPPVPVYALTSRGSDLARAISAPM